MLQASGIPQATVQMTRPGTKHKRPRALHRWPAGIGSARALKIGELCRNQGHHLFAEIVERVVNLDNLFFKFLFAFVPNLFDPLECFCECRIQFAVVFLHGRFGFSGCLLRPLHRLCHDCGLSVDGAVVRAGIVASGNTEVKRLLGTETSRVGTFCLQSPPCVQSGSSEAPGLSAGSPFPVSGGLVAA